MTQFWGLGFVAPHRNHVNQTSIEIEVLANRLPRFEPAVGFQKDAL
jgi:hypothetical protein